MAQALIKVKLSFEPEDDVNGEACYVCGELIWVDGFAVNLTVARRTERIFQLCSSCKDVVCNEFLN